jgi:micrococcal nuclease
MRQIIVSFFILTSLFIAPFAWAAESTTTTPARFPVADYNDLRGAGSVKVTQVIDPMTFGVEDKRIIELIGIDYPDLKVYEAGDFALTAKNVLTDMLDDHDVTLYQTGKADWGRSNRMGHELAHVERSSDKAWVQGTLLALGLARVRTSQRNPEMSEQMYKLENAARAEKLGIWADARFKVLTPEEAGANMHTFQIVEGKIESVSLKSNRLYLNFGKDWKSDFTVSIAPRDKRLFSQANMDPMSWNNKTIRARGWVRSYNGPYMEIDHPQAIELIDSPAP